MNENIIPSQDRSKESKERILSVALELFANNGFDKTSTREIAKKANVNISAIKYYFGDKESLYKTVYRSFVGPSKEHRDNYQRHESLEEQLEQMFSIILFVFKEKNNKYGRKLHMREQLDPMGLWLEDIENDIKPKHYQLNSLIKKEIPLMNDDDVNRLAFSIVSLFLGLFVNQDVINAMNHKLITEEDSLKKWKNQLISYANAMIEIEKKKYKEKI